MAALGDELHEFIESLIELGDYCTQSDVILESLRLPRKIQAELRIQANEIYWQKTWAAASLWRGKMTYLWKKLKQVRGLPLKTVKLTPKVSQELEDIWYYGYEHFGKGLHDIYIN